MKLYRPRGVIALAIIFIILAACGIITAVWIEILFVVDYNSLYRDLFFMLNLIYSPSIPPPLAIAFILLGNLANSTFDILFRASSLQWLVVSLLLFFGIFIIDGIGLLKMKKWGYYLALVLGILFIITFTILIILGIAILVYLLVSDVKYEFK